MRNRRCLPLVALLAVSLILAMSVPVAKAQESKAQAEGVKLQDQVFTAPSNGQKQIEVYQASFTSGGYIQGNFPEPMLIQVEEGPFVVQVQPGGRGVVYVVPPDGRPQRVKPVDCITTKCPDDVYLSVESGSAIVLTGQADCFL